jgi:CHAD domain-containing protein
MDVYLLGFDQYKHILPPEYRAYLEPLRAFLQEHQRSEQQAMVRKIDSPNFRAFCKEWREFLQTPVLRVPLAHNAIRPVQEIASSRIDKIFRRVLKEGLGITADSPAEDLHELRKSCKKLRYLMEFFQSLYPKKKMSPLIKALKRLLDNLGDFQDMEVQANKIKEFAHQMVEERSVPADTLLAMGILVDDLLRRQRQARDSFADCFADFATKENRKVLYRLCASAAKGGGG